MAYDTTSTHDRPKFRRAKFRSIAHDFGDFQPVKNNVNDSWVRMNRHNDSYCFWELHCYGFVIVFYYEDLSYLTLSFFREIKLDVFLKVLFCLFFPVLNSIQFNVNVFCLWLSKFVYYIYFICYWNLNTWAHKKSPVYRIGSSDNFTYCR